MAFLKTCFECGAQVKKLYEGKCENCFKEENPPVKEVKQVTFKIDNVSKKICYNNHFYEQDQIEKMLPDIMKRRVIMNKNYVFKDLEIENFEIDGHKLIFDLVVESEFKDE